MTVLRRRLDRLVVSFGYWRVPRLASRLRQRWVRIRNPHVDISFGAGCYLGPGFSIHAPDGGTFRVGDDCEFRRHFQAELVGPDATIEIGNRCRFTYGCAVSCATRITFAEDVTIARSLVTDAVLGTPGGHRRPVHIDAGSLVHVMSTVAASIGERAVVGANAAVNDDVPAWAIAGGVPARVLEFYGPPAGDARGVDASISVP